MAYEDEVAGAAYFDALASAFPQQSGLLEKCTAFERAIAIRFRNREQDQPLPDQLASCWVSSEVFSRVLPSHDFQLPQVCLA